MTFNSLKKGDIIFIDANIFIYNFGAQSVECKELLLRCAKGDLTGYTLTSVLSEVLHSLILFVMKRSKRLIYTNKAP